MGSNPILSAIHINANRFLRETVLLFLLGIIAWSSNQLDSALWRGCIKHHLLSQFIEKGRCEHELRTECGSVDAGQCLAGKAPTILKPGDRAEVVADEGDPNAIRIHIDAKRSPGVFI